MEKIIEYITKTKNNKFDVFDLKFSGIVLELIIHDNDKAGKFIHSSKNPVVYEISDEYCELKVLYHIII